MIIDWIHCCFKDRFVEAIFFLYLVYLKTHMLKMFNNRRNCILPF